MIPYNLDQEEEKVLAAVESGRWKSVKNVGTEIKRYRQVARRFAAKPRNINLRVSERTFWGLRSKALAEGLPYQTLAASVLHKYALAH
jgi:predicted DNA binding CopG/RHH family protein